MELKHFISNGRFSGIVQKGDCLYLSGLTSDKEGIAEQTSDILARLEERLEQYGSDKRHILRATIFIKDMKDFDGMNAVWDAWVDRKYEPARACVTANMSDEHKLIEIVVDATLRE